MAPVLPSLVVVLLHAHPAAVDETALGEAVSVYIRDLGYDVESDGDAPSTISPEELARVAGDVRGRGAKLAFWCRSRQTVRGNEVVLFTVVDEGEVRAMPVAGVSGVALARVLALKVRAVLTGKAEREVTLPVPAPVVSRAPPPSAAAPSATPPASAAAPAQRPAAATIATPPPAPTSAALRPTRLRGWFSAGYRLTIPTDSQAIRHRALLEAALAIHWLELSLAAEIGNEPSQRFANGIASLGDYPIRIGARGRIGRGRWSFAGGPVASLHVFDVDAISTSGANADRVVVAAGLGAEVGGQVRITDHIAAQVRVLVDYVLPEHRFLLQGDPAFVEGGVRIGLAAAFAFAMP